MHVCMGCSCALPSSNQRQLSSSHGCGRRSVSAAEAIQPLFWYIVIIIIIIIVIIIIIIFKLLQSLSYYNKFRLCGYGKVVQATISSLVQIIILVKSGANINYCGVVLITAISSSIVVLIMTLFEIVFQSNSLTTSSDNDTTISNDNRDGSINSSDIELSATRVTHRISTTNPMISV